MAKKNKEPELPDPKDFTREVTIPWAERVISGQKAMVNALGMSVFGAISFPFIFLNNYGKKSYRLFEQDRFNFEMIRRGFAPENPNGPHDVNMHIIPPDDEDKWMKEHKEEYGDEDE